MKLTLNHIILAAMLLTGLNALGQQTTITGKVTDAASGDPVPFANVVFINTSIGTTTDFDGNYTLTTNNPTDSLRASYMGYKPKTKFIKKGTTQSINFQLVEDVISLAEVVVEAGENPAFEILRKVVDNKKQNDKRSLEAYQYETYTKIELDVDNMTDKFRDRKTMRKITQVMDSVEQIAGDDGKPILPVFMSESISNFYYRTSPELKKEFIVKTNVNGIGVDDGSFSSQYIGSTFQEYNFYKNWLNIVSKDFVSPIADGWRIYYEYDLTDSMDINGYYCYRLDFFPKSEQDLAFTGTMWITKEGYALKQIDVTVNKTANLNYIEKIKIQQELEPTEAGPWIPVKNRVLLDVGEITAKSAGMLAKFYTSNKNIEVNQPKDTDFYSQTIEVAEDYLLRGKDDNYWEEHRHEPLTETELSVYSMIDTLVNIPIVRTYTEIVEIAVNGYYKAGKLDIGPYLSVYANNEVEGHRFQLGLRTNIDFSDKWVFGGRLAYGTKDEELKYRAFGEYIFSRSHWTKVQLSYTRDIDQVGLSEVDLMNNSVFLTASKFGRLVKPYYYNEGRLTFEREFFKGFSQKVIIRNRHYQPANGYFDFAYYTNPNDVTSPIATNFSTTEVVLESRYAKGEVYLQNDNNRFAIKQGRWPVFTLRYTQGIKGVLNSNFEYEKLALNVQKNFNVGLLGVSKVSLTGEQIFSKLPYPLLKVHIGNESLFYTTAAYNQMLFSEFASDRYATLRYYHHFEGFLLNRVPLIKKLKWRLLASGSVLYGDLSAKNRNIIPLADLNGNPVEQPGYLKPTTPYIELGYGIENIFKIVRIDAIHRITYLDNTKANNFGVKISLQFIL